MNSQPWWSLITRLVAFDYKVDGVWTQGWWCLIKRLVEFSYKIGGILTLRLVAFDYNVPTVPAGEDKPVLTISGLTLENAGNYYCLASTCDMKVIPGPFFVLYSSST